MGGCLEIPPDFEWPNPGTTPPPPVLCGVEVHLDSVQAGILGQRRLEAFSRQGQVAFLNFTAAAASAGVNLRGFSFQSFDKGTGNPDRMWFRGDTTSIERALDATGSGFTKNVGPKHSGINNHYRQDHPWMSLQIGIGDGEVEIDIDYFAPQMGLAPAIGHGFEFLWNHLFKKHTDPYLVAEGLRGKKINVGHGCDRENK